VFPDRIEIKRLIRAEKRCRHVKISKRITVQAEDIHYNAPKIITLREREK
jgi:hypothetical protein